MRGDRDLTTRLDDLAERIDDGDLEDDDGDLAREGVAEICRLKARVADLEARDCSDGCRVERAVEQFNSNLAGDIISS